jgi:citrate/tricarballylate utilization protein
MPHNTMALLFGIVSLYAMLAIAFGVRAFWCDIGAPPGTRNDPRNILQAIRDAGRLRYLDGGGAGCMNEDERPEDRRRLYHHLTFYGFLLCFASTSVATVYDHFIGHPAPYPFLSLPVQLGTWGGVLLLVGTVGLLWLKLVADQTPTARALLGADVALLVLLALTSLTGLLLLALRATSAMGVLLAVHLGVVLALFVVLPYSKFVHGIYRSGALLRYAIERRAREVPDPRNEERGMATAVEGIRNPAP